MVLGLGKPCAKGIEALLGTEGLRGCDVLGSLVTKKRENSRPCKLEWGQGFWNQGTCVHCLHIFYYLLKNPPKKGKKNNPLITLIGKNTFWGRFLSKQ